MKIAFALLVILPMVFSMPEKRLILDTLLQGAELKTLVDGIVGQLGSDASEQACEAECHTLIQQDHLLQFGCPLICKSLQSLAHRYGHATAAPTAKTSLVVYIRLMIKKKCTSQLLTKTVTMKIAFALLVILPMVFSMPEKRLLLESLFKATELKTLVDGIVGQLGSDASEQACEAECHTLIQQDHLLQFGCPIICKSLQSLAHRYGHPTEAPTAKKTKTMKLAFALLLVLPVVFSMPQKRLLLDTVFKGTELKTLVDGLVGTLGTDATEQACETECHVLIQQDHLLQFGCPLVCKRVEE
ncbi:uncharacterized protein LOC134704802 [Mytilus trossulus]|uniref:uncharacterized protein LOC134704802 n=1 Tax=Mytilus trossulus TaxID=6551 RepID=UPI003005BE54